ncbi:MAG: methyltransferase domain-containing protein [Halobacteriota archaeon]|nr:methyltransferase domain-containing protein [Halobacteriota archaeon]
MTDFNDTDWSGEEVVRWYLKEADMRVVDRRKQIEILKSFYNHFIGVGKGSKVLDLGCGDGIITQELLEFDGSIVATLIDGSEHMLENARTRLTSYENIRFIRLSFQELLKDDSSLKGKDYDLIFSSLAIHHLADREKKPLFECIYSHLKDDGCFVNLDIILSPSKTIEEWYLKLWRDWMRARQREYKIDDGTDDAIRRYLKEDHYRQLSTLDDQIGALRDIGFKDVDCLYKHGIFSIYAGRK